MIGFLDNMKQSSAKQNESLQALRDEKKQKLVMIKRHKEMISKLNASHSKHFLNRFEEVTNSDFAGTINHNQVVPKFNIPQIIFDHSNSTPF